MREFNRVAPEALHKRGSSGTAHLQARQTSNFSGSCPHSRQQRKAKAGLVPPRSSSSSPLSLSSSC
eukprot:10238834-Karenia_brevis.AAC.1